MAEWTETNEQLKKMIQQNIAVDEIKHPIQTLGTASINAFHKFGGGDFSLLFHCAMEKNLGAMKALLDAGADPTLRNPSGNSVLNLIVKRNNVEMAKAVIQSITDLDKKKEFVNSKSKIGWTHLMTCADNDYAEMAKYLIECGANVNETMSSGWTAMHTAAKKKNAKVLKVFLTNGGNQHLKARHREFGSNLAVADVAKDSQNIQELLQKYSN